MNHAVPSSRLEILVDRIANWLIAQRKLLSFVFIAITLALGASALRVQLDPGFNKLIPLSAPVHGGLPAAQAAPSRAPTASWSACSWKGEGDIYNAEFMQVLRGSPTKCSSPRRQPRRGALDLHPQRALHRGHRRRLQRRRGDPVRFVADPENLAQVRANVAKSGRSGAWWPTTSNRRWSRPTCSRSTPDRQEARLRPVAKKLEAIRAAHANEVDIQIVGFAKVMGDVMDGLTTVLLFFVIAFGVTTILLWLYSRSIKLTVLAITVALLPVVWLLGILPLIGYGIDPMSVLVPFLIFSIGVSHAVQMTNAWKQDVLDGQTALDAAEGAFRKLAIPGTVALLTNAWASW
jgi:hypothetical protein